jgi:hypothetical protein
MNTCQICGQQYETVCPHISASPQMHLLNKILHDVRIIKRAVLPQPVASMTMTFKTIDQPKT